MAAARRWAKCTVCGHVHRRSPCVLLLPCCKCGGEVVLRSRRRPRVRLIVHVDERALAALGPRPTLVARWLVETAARIKREETGA